MDLTEHLENLLILQDTWRTEGSYRILGELTYITEHGRNKGSYLEN